MSFLQADLAQVLLVERQGTAHFPEELRDATSLRGLAAQLDCTVLAARPVLAAQV